MIFFYFITSVEEITLSMKDGIQSVAKSKVFDQALGRFKII